MVGRRPGNVNVTNYGAAKGALWCPSGYPQQLPPSWMGGQGTVP